MKSFTIIHILFITSILSISILALFKALENQLYIGLLEKKDNLIRGTAINSSKDLLKNQRHDFMNLFQVIYGYLQMDNKDKALNQIMRINSMASSISKAYRISIFSISMLLEEKIKKADNYSVHLEYNIYSALNENLRIVQNENHIIEKIDNIFDIIIKKAYEQNNENVINIDIHEYDNDIIFTFKGDILAILDDNIKGIYPHAFVENDIVKIKFKYQKPERLYIKNTTSSESRKNTFKSINLRDY